MNLDPILTPTQAVGLFNMLFEETISELVVMGEVSDFRLSKNTWVYMTIKDAQTNIRCFGHKSVLNYSISNGMQVELTASPSMHNVYGFSLNIISLSPVGDGSINNSYILLKQKLTIEGIFEPSRKRLVESCPGNISLISSSQAAGYGDFVKIIDDDRVGVDNICFYDVGVQGLAAVDQILVAIERAQLDDVKVIVMIRGGGSAEDLDIFNSERIVRAIAGSRVPTLVAIGHERDQSLSEEAADMRASTPSQAAHYLTLSKSELIVNVAQKYTQLLDSADLIYAHYASVARNSYESILEKSLLVLSNKISSNKLKLSQVTMADPAYILSKGYSLVYNMNGNFMGKKQLEDGQQFKLRTQCQTIEAIIQQVSKREAI